MLLLGETGWWELFVLSLQFFFKTKIIQNRKVYSKKNPIWLQRIENSNKYSYINGHNSSIHNNQKVETTQVSINV